MKYKIEKGDRFKCLKTFKMEDGEVAYTKNRTYLSEVNKSITDNQFDVNHDMQDMPEFFEHFKPIPNE